MQRTNANTVSRIIWEDGTDQLETHRVEFGGFLNMIDRIANANGMPGRRVFVRSEERADGHRWFMLKNGRSFRIEEGWSK